MVSDPYEVAITKVIDAQERAARDFPSTLVDGHRVHIFEEGGRWQVWINTEVTEFDGLCVGTGLSRGGAIADARIALLAIAGFLGKEQLVGEERPHVG